MRAFKVLCTASALVFACQSAPAATRISGMIDAEFERSGDHYSDHANSVGGVGAMLISFADPGLNVQVAGGGATSLSGDSTTIWAGNGDLFWRDGKGTIGASVAHGSLRIAGLDAGLTAYGAFAEWYASQHLTLRLKGGGVSGDASGVYGGVGTSYYIHPFASLFAEGDYVRIMGISEWTGTAGIEGLLSSNVPLSIRAGTSYSTAAGTNTTSFFVALVYRIHLSGTLIDLDRTGPVSWNGGLSLL